MIQKSHFIFYVRNQETSTLFYSSVLEMEPVLNVPGMTEYELSATCVLGLMPESGITRLLNHHAGAPADAGKSLKAELYLVVTDAQSYLRRATGAGGSLLSPVAKRDWGHRVGYLLDPDGYVLAFAEPVAVPEAEPMA